MYVGTSGWSYSDWRGRFYPEQVPRRQWLEYYASQFMSVEINGSFYRTPSLEAVRAWSEATPAGFRFSWKASTFITHWKRLGTTAASSLELMETRLAVLGRKCGPVLFQLPPLLARDDALLADFKDMLPPRRRYAFEFRHPSWYADNVLEFLSRRRAAMCISDHHDAPSPWTVTADFAYVRGHGPGGRYKGNYEIKVLRDWS